MCRMNVFEAFPKFTNLYACKSLTFLTFFTLGLGPLLVGGGSVLKKNGTKHKFMNVFKHHLLMSSGYSILPNKSHLLTNG